jgi:hypothetical protein
MNTNSTYRAKNVTEGDHRTFSYVQTLANTVFEPEHHPVVLVYRSPANKDYVATLTARRMVPVPSVLKMIDFGVHRGTTREEALLGLLESLEGAVAAKNHRNKMEYAEECCK